MRDYVKLNNGWFFMPDFKEEYLAKTDFSDFQTVNIPHIVKEIPYDCFDDSINCMITTYAKYIELPERLPKRVFLTFDGVSLAFDLYINGRHAGLRQGPWSISFFDISEYVVPGKNLILCKVDSTENPAIPPCGEIKVDFLMYGGIYRDVKLYLQDSSVITNVKAGYKVDVDLQGEKGNVILAPELHLDHSGKAGEAKIKIQMTRDGEEVHVYTRHIFMPEGQSTVLLEEEKIECLDLWNPGKPALYQLDFSMEFDDGRSHAEDFFTCRVGFRKIEVTKTGFYINGKKIKLIGTNRHQSYPYVGYALGKKAQVKDADLLMEFGMNMVRCSHYMQSNYFLDRADEIGLLIFEEIPGWGFVGDEAYKQATLCNIVNMVNSHFNHPSIVIWGTRLNETLDDDEFYTKTNSLCKSLDSSRPTTGVRYHKLSNLIEDIYSFNDYPEEEGLGRLDTLQAPKLVTGRPEGVPYLVAEHSGAQLVAKPWDLEKHQEFFGLVQAKFIQDVLVSDEFLGELGWCAFDYNTHSDHDLHERICYHGIFDMYRVPKLAAYVYKSQLDPKKALVMEPCATIGRGERSGNCVPFWVFTNCDYIEVKFSNDIFRRYYPSGKYLGMPHPPIEVTENGEFWQVPWAGAVVIGFVDGKEVIRREYPVNSKLCMDVHVDDDVLCNKEQDETRIECLYCDEKHNRMYSHCGAASISVTGDIELIGPSIRSMMAGSLTFWVRTKATGISQEASVTIHTDRDDLEDRTIFLKLEV